MLGPICFVHWKYKEKEKIALFQKMNNNKTHGHKAGRHDDNITTNKCIYVYTVKEKFEESPKIDEY